MFVSVSSAKGQATHTMAFCEIVTGINENDTAIRQ